MGYSVYSIADDEVAVPTCALTFPFPRAVTQSFLWDASLFPLQRKPLFVSCNLIACQVPHSLDKCLLNNFYVSDTVLDAGDRAVNKKMQITSFTELRFKNIPVSLPSSFIKYNIELQSYGSVRDGSK